GDEQSLPRKLTNNSNRLFCIYEVLLAKQHPLEHHATAQQVLLLIVSFLNLILVTILHSYQSIFPLLVLVSFPYNKLFHHHQKTMMDRYLVLLNNRDQTMVQQDL